MEACWWRIFDERVRPALSSLANWLRNPNSGALSRAESGRSMEKDPSQWGLEELLEKLQFPGHWLSSQHRLPAPCMPSDVYHFSPACTQRLFDLWRPIEAALALCFCAICERSRGMVVGKSKASQMSSEYKGDFGVSAEVHDLGLAA